MLEKKKLIVKRTDDYGNDPLWMLTKCGLEEISLNLPELRQKFLMSECIPNPKEHRPDGFWISITTAL